MGILRLRASGEGRTNREYSRLKWIVLVCMVVAAAGVAGGVASPAAKAQSASNAPTARNDYYTTSEDRSLEMKAPGVLGNDSTYDGGGKLSAERLSDPQHGKVSVNGDGSFVYTPDENFAGRDSFTYRARDNRGGTATATVTIDVQAVNDAPVAKDDAYRVTKNQTLRVSAPGVLGNDTDVENNKLYALMSTYPKHGSLSVNGDGSFVYTPTKNFEGTDSFVYVATDHVGGAPTATVTITVAPPNRAPAADDDSYEVDEDQTLNVAAPGVLDGDTDAEGDQLSAVKASDPAHGQLTLNPDGSFSYKPNANFNGSDSFTYKANDGKTDGNTATVRITAKAVQDKPAAANDSYGVDEEKTLTVDDGPNDVLANDADADGDTLTAALVNGPGNGQLTLNPDGSFSYEPGENFNGSDSFTYKANDGKEDSNEATVSITVNSVNDAPALTLTGGPDTSEVDESDATHAYEFTVADGDPGDDFTIKDGFPDCGEGGELVENSLSKTAAGGSFECRFVDGPASPTVSMQVSDGDADSNIATKGGLTVKNAKPTVEFGAYNPDTGANDATVDESTTAQRTYTFTVADPGDDTFEVEQDFPTCGQNGTLVENSLATDASGGSFECVFPDGNTTSDVAIKVKDSDGLSDTDNRVVKVTVDNEAPTATFNAPDSVGEGEDVEISLTGATDPAGNNDTIEYRFKCGDADWGAYGDTNTASCPTTDDGEVVVKGQVRDEDGGESEEYQKTVTVNNAKPSVTAAADQSADEGEDKGFKLGSFADPGSDGDWTITVDWGDGSEDTTFTANLPGDLPDRNHVYADDGVYTVTVTVAEDGTGAPSGSATFKVTVANLAPTATAQAVETRDGVSKTITLAGSDPGSDDLSFEITTLPAHGKLYNGQSTAAADEIASGDLPYALSGNEVTYVPGAGYDGPDAFDFKADDGTDKSDAATVSITVTEFNDPPVADDDSAETAEDTPVTIDVKDGDSPGAANESGQTLTVSKITTGPAHGTATIIDSGADAGKVRYAPSANYNGPDSFEYEVCDDGTTNRAPDPKCDTATVNVTVTAVNDKPAAVNDAYGVDEDGTLTVSASDPPAGPAPGVLGNDTDVDDGDTLSVADADGNAQGIQPVSGPAHGTLTLEADGSFVYTPEANYFGDDTFTYKANDGTVDSDAATVTITVRPVNDPPNAVDDSTDTDEDTDKVIDVLVNDEIAPDTGETLSVQSVTDSPHGTVSKITTGPDSGKVLYKPDANYFGDDSLTYTISDGNGGTDTATVDVTVNPVNDAPVADDETFDTANRAVGNTSLVGNDPDDGAPDPAGPQKTITGDILAGDADVDGPGPLVVQAGTINTNDGGTVDIESDGDFTFHPKAGTSCTDHSDFFDYTVTDQNSTTKPGTAGTDTGRVTIEIQDCVWYVDASAGSNGDGRSHSPFNTLNVTGGSGLNGAGGTGDSDASGQTIFVYPGTYTGGLPLENNQTLFSKRHGLTVPDGGSGNVTLEPAAGPNTTIANATGNALTLASNNTIQGIDLGSTNAASASLAGGSVGSATMNTSTSGSINNTSGGAVDISGGTLNMTLAGVSSSGATNDGIRLDNTSGTFTGSGGSIQNAGGQDIDITGNNSGDTVDFIYNGSITDDQGALVNVSGQNGGTKDFNGAITDNNDGDGNGISLTTNAGATVRFDGGLTLSTGTANAFSAIGGGTLAVTDPAGATDNTIATTTGAALNVANTTIGSNGLTFKSISANGAAKGIVLNNTGSTAGLTVTGNNVDTTTAASRGTNNSGGIIQNTTGAGISLTGTLNPSFTNVHVLNTDLSGVEGTDVTNFTFKWGKISDSGTNHVLKDSNIRFNTGVTENNLDGVVTITGNLLERGYDDGVGIHNYNGTIGDLNVSNNTVTSATTQANSQGNGIQIVAFGNESTAASITKAAISGNTINNIPVGVGLSVQCGNSNASGPGGTCGTPGNATNTIAITNNAVSGQSATTRIGSEGILASVQGGRSGATAANAAGRGQGNFDINNNTVTNVFGHGISHSTFGNSTVTSKVTNNTIDQNNAGAQIGSQGIGGGTGVVHTSSETPLMTVQVSSNTITDYDGDGIRLVSLDTTGTLNATVTNNSVGPQIASGFPNRIRVDSGNGPGENNTVNLKISGNIATGTSNPGTTPGIGLRKEGTDPNVNKFAIEGLSPPSGATNAQVIAYVTNQNPSMSTGSASVGYNGTDKAEVINGSGFVATSGSVPAP